MGPVVVFGCPVEFVVGEACRVEAAEEAEDVGVVVEVAEVIAVVFEGAGFVPTCCYARRVLPVVEEL